MNNNGKEEELKKKKIGQIGKFQIQVQNLFMDQKQNLKNIVINMLHIYIYIYIFNILNQGIATRKMFTWAQGDGHTSKYPVWGGFFFFLNVFFLLMKQK